MVKSFVKTSDKRMKLVYKKVIEPQLGNLISIIALIIINKIKIVLNVENIRNVFAGKMIKYHYPYVSKYIYRTQDLAKVASFSDSKPQKQHYAKINGLEKLIINTGNEPFH